MPAYATYIIAADGFPYQLSIVDNGDGTFSEVWTRVAASAPSVYGGITGKGIIDDALTLVKNNSTSVRNKMLTWLNICAQKLAVIRPWLFLGNGSATIIPTSNIIVLPVDYGGFKGMYSGRDFYFTAKNKLDSHGAWLADAADGDTPKGYTEQPASITLHGGTFADPVTLQYTIAPPQIFDTEDATVWPNQCRPLLVRSLVDFFYEYDMDERAALSYQLNAGELSILKAWDNRQKPWPQPDNHGYMRGR